jgi:predicted MFS family arabinose efflux permease
LVLVEFAFFIPVAYICLYATYWEWDFQEALLLNVWLNLGAVPGRLLPNYVADRLGSVNTMTIISFLCMVLVLGLWIPAQGGQALTIAYTVLYGFWSGASVALAPVCIGQVCRTEDYGKRNGTAYTLCSFGTLIGIPIAGALLEADGGSYRALIIFAGLLYVLSFVAYLAARILLGGRKLLQVC